MINGMNDVNKVTITVRQNDTDAFLVGMFKIRLHSHRSTIIEVFLYHK